MRSRSVSGFSDLFRAPNTVQIGAGRPSGYDVLDATALGRRLGLKRDTVLAYLSRRNFGRIPKPNRKLPMGPVWFERTVEEWEKRKRDG